LRAADVGISVDTATDIAKESADLILLEKDLMVLEGGGRGPEGLREYR
jgi:Mg2+-importing ATPase